MKPTNTIYLAGVDGGGTGCRAVIADLSGRVRGRGKAGPANVTTDAQNAVSNVRAALQQAIENADIGEVSVGQIFTHIGLAGVMNETSAAPIAKAMLVNVAQISDDRTTSVAGALKNRSGILAAIGTGTTLAAQHNGHMRHIGGWGFDLGDQASGAWLGRALLQQVLLCHDGLALHSALTQETLDQFDGKPDSLVGFAATARPVDFADFARNVIKAGENGDTNARQIMERGANYLCQAFEVLDFEGCSLICLSGGVGPHYTPYLPAQFRDRITPPAGNALDGALFLARQAYERRNR